MKTLFLGACAALLLATGLRGTDSVWNYTVEIGVAVQTLPAQITLTWPQDTNGAPGSYAVYRKAPSAADWGTPLATLSGDKTQFTDSSVTVGSAYEYQIIKDFSTRGYRGYGYVQAGIDVPLTEHRGTLVLIVDTVFSSTLAPELQRLTEDLIGDGWRVVRHDVARGDAPATVKDLIRADYQAAPDQVNAVLLFGHVPVPYSGAINPDGHAAHRGAWPADVYYADLDGQWTDTSLTSRQTGNSDPAENERLTNLPGDGKFDQSTIPGTARLMLGRVDLTNLPGFLDYQSRPSFPNELELHRQYLNKDHAFRHAVLTVQRRAAIGDYSGDKGGTAAAASGYRSFAPLVGEANVIDLASLNHDATGVWLEDLAKNDYLFSLGCGAGSYATISGLGPHGPYGEVYSTDLVSRDVRAVFVMMFGSWCGDWNSQDNIIRSVLATPRYGLAALFTGAPHWFLHPMGLGETIGYATRLTQNNSGLYRHQTLRSPRGVHIALMGDPSLRLYAVPPPGTVSATAAASGVEVRWTASSDPGVIGYQVFRAAAMSGAFTRLTTSPVAASSFTDPGGAAGAVYLVRAVKREVTPSGSFLNESQGIFATASGSGSVTAPPAGGGSPARLINLSVRARAEASGTPLALGFVVGGAGAAGDMPVLLRATGPALRAFGVSDVLPDPFLSLYRGSAALASDDNWGAYADQVSATAAAVGAFPLTDPTSRDAALIASCPPSAYSAEVSGGGTAGTTLVEVYDATPSSGVAARAVRLINLSVRSSIRPGGDTLAVGFVVAGSGSLEVLIRGIGPGLERFGIGGTLARPQLTVVASDGRIMATNVGWGGEPALAAAFSEVGAFTLDATSADSALVVSLRPGAYTVQLTSANGGAGLALAEVYEKKQTP